MMNNATPSAARWYPISLMVATGLALCVIVLGAYVRLSDAGLGCPDWPGCYGHLVLPGDEVARDTAQARFPERPIEAGKAWREMVHRYLATSLGLAIIAVTVTDPAMRPSLSVTSRCARTPARSVAPAASARGSSASIRRRPPFIPGTPGTWPRGAGVARSRAGQACSVPE